MIQATCKLESISPYSQSDFIKSARKDGEDWNAFEERVWRERLHVDREGIVFIPPMGFKKCLDRAASLLQMKWKKSSTYSKLFLTGVMIAEGPSLGIKLEDVECEWLQLDANPSQKGGSKVPKCMPVIRDWTCTANFIVLSTEISQSVFEQHLIAAGSMVGVGRFRPEKGGYYGRFQVNSVEWSG